MQEEQIEKPPVKFAGLGELSVKSEEGDASAAAFPLAKFEEDLRALLASKIGQPVTEAFQTKLKEEIQNLIPTPRILGFHAEIGIGKTPDSLGAVVTRVIGFEDAEPGPTE